MPRKKIEAEVTPKVKAKAKAEPKAKAEQKAEPKVDWHEGEPPQVGWYNVLVDGKEDRLQWWICMMNPRKRKWKNEDGQYVVGDIKWTGKAEVRP